MNKQKNSDRYIGSGYFRLTQPYRFIIPLPVDECISRLDDWSPIRTISAVKTNTIYNYRIYNPRALGIYIKGHVKALDEEVIVIEGNGAISFTILLIMITFIIVPALVIEDNNARIIAPLVMSLPMGFFWITLLAYRQNMILALEKLLSPDKKKK